MTQINEVSLERTFNLGNYNAIKIKVSKSPSPGEEITVPDMLTEINAEILTASEKLMGKDKVHQ